MTPLLTVDGVTVSFGSARALDHVSFTVEAGSVTGLIGPNGAGKTTLIDVVSGFVTPDHGSVLLDGSPLLERRTHDRARLGIARTFQSLELFDDLPVQENLRIAADGAATGGVDTAAVATRLGLEIGDRRPARGLSQGERSGLALARALVGRPRLLLLDEPAAGLDADARRELAALVRETAADGTAVLLVDHDLALVLEVCDRVLVLDLGRVVADGTPAEIRADPTVAAVYVGSAAAARRPAGKAAAADREAAARARGLCAGYGAGPVVRDVDLEVAHGEVVALLGPNGAGKTTTLLALSGVLHDAQGEVDVLGHRMRPGRIAASPHGVAHVLQSRRVFADLTARENLRLVDASGEGTAQALELFPALRPVLDRPAGRLSGGEQQMLALARALATRPRLLLVDELSLGLAPKVVADLLRSIRASATEHAMAVLLAEQHAALALEIADRAYVLAAGRVTATGTAADLAADPARLLRAYLGDG